MGRNLIEYQTEVCNYMWKKDEYMTWVLDGTYLAYCPSKLMYPGYFLTDVRC